MSGGTKAVESLKTKLLGELHLMTPADLRAYWKQTRWPKPNLVTLANNAPSPLAFALRKLPPRICAEACKQLDPFGWLLEAVDVSEWSDYCQKHDAPWMTRVWLAAASQLRAEHRLIHRAHGWADAWEELRRNPDKLRYAEEFFFAELRHATTTRRPELLATPGLDERLAKARQEKDEAFLRRFRRAQQGAGQRAGVALAEKYTVQHWLELPKGFPGLCFFSDSALHSLLEAFVLSTGEDCATKQLRRRLGLIQAGAKRHKIEEVIEFGGQLSFTGTSVEQPWTFSGGVISWGSRRLWPRSQ